MKLFIQLFATIILALVAMFFMLVAISNILGQDCANGQCSAPAKVSAPSQNANYAWSAGVAGQHLLRRDGVTVGQWFEGQYYPWDGSKTLPACKPPIDPPEKNGLSKEQRQWCNNGISGLKLASDQLSFSGRVIKPGRLHEAFNGQLQDDSEKGYLVIIAKDSATREKVFADWKNLPADFTDRYLVWQAPPDHFSMQDRFAGKGRFFTEGDPTVVLQAHDGTVLFRRPQAGQSYKASDMQDLLKSDPSYNPHLDPGGPQSTPAFPMSVQTTTSLVLAGAGVLALILGRKK